jgi:1,4-alpha-glucan branching enzyme
MQRDPIYRKYHAHDLTFGLTYAWSERFILPLSHDEVVHGKGSLISRMPGDRWQQFANLRAYFGFMWAHPGKKLLFMGGEFAQWREWNHDEPLHWHLLSDPSHRGVFQLLGDLNRLLHEEPALHRDDHEPRGFQWVFFDVERSIYAFMRKAEDASPVLVICNFTPEPQLGYRVGVPHAGNWREICNTDSAFYGGSNLGNAGVVSTEAIAAHGHGRSLRLVVPPLATVFLRPEFT